MFHALRANSFSDLSLAAIIVVALPGLWQAGGFAVSARWPGTAWLSALLWLELPEPDDGETGEGTQAAPDNLDRNPCRVVEAWVTVGRLKVGQVEEVTPQTVNDTPRAEEWFASASRLAVPNRKRCGRRLARSAASRVRWGYVPGVSSRGSGSVTRVAVGRAGGPRQASTARRAKPR